MIKKTINYENFDGEEVSEEAHFHLTKAELLELEYEEETPFTDYLKQMQNSTTPKTVLHVLKRLIEASYGQRSEDGRRFIKNEELTSAFVSSDAYSELLFGLLNDPKEATNFFESIMPAKLLAQAKAEMEKNPDLVKDFVPSEGADEGKHHAE